MIFGAIFSRMIVTVFLFPFMVMGIWTNFDIPLMAFLSHQTIPMKEGLLG